MIGKVLKCIPRIKAWLIMCILVLSCTNNASTEHKIEIAKNYFTALNASSSAQMSKLIGDSLLTRIPKYDYRIYYSKKNYINNWLKWDSVFKPRYKVLAMSVENGNVIATLSKSDQRIDFFMHKPFLTQETLRFKKGKIVVVETEYLNFNEKLWATNRAKLLDWVALNHPENKGFINDQNEAGAKKFLEMLSAYKDKDKRYLFFLHNRFLEEHKLDEVHPQYGRTQYQEILETFQEGGLEVISKIRTQTVNARQYATGVINQIDSLIAAGVKPDHITVAGTSKGGYIAQYVATLANNPDLNYVFIASFRTEDLEAIPDINFCGNILTIYEKTDPFGISALPRKESSTCEIKHFKEIELHTGMGHGFLFKPLQEWIEPTIRWAKGNYELSN